MPANNEFPTLDGITPSWADVVVALTIGGASLLPMNKIAAINTSTTVEVGKQMAGGRVMKRTTGALSDEASMTLYYGGLPELLRGLAPYAPTRGNQRLVGLVNFGVQIQYLPPGADEIFDIRLKGCRLLGLSANGAEGTDPNKVEIALNPMQVVHMVDGEEFVLL